MERRRNPRSKQRIPCEVKHGESLHRGIAVNFSRSGLFVQTSATLDFGADVEVGFLEEPLGNAPLRARVAHRRAVPALLATVIRPGLGLEITEAPDAYLEFLGERNPLASSPLSESESDDLDIEIIICDDADPEDPADAASCVIQVPEIPVPVTPAEEPADEEPAQEAEAEQEILEPAEAEAPWPPANLYRSEALLIDDGELDDVYAMLEAMGTDPIRRRAIANEDFRDWEEPPRVVVVSALAASRVTVVRRANEANTVTIAVAEAGSQTLSGMLRRQGFDFVVRRPVHPEALRLMLMRALYRGPERRSEPRLPIGCSVTTRWGILWWSTRLLDISASGCRFRGREPLEPGTRVLLRIPREVTGGRRLTLCGRVRRSESARRAVSEAGAVIALSFDPLRKRTRERLDALLASSLTGPPASSRAGARASRPVRLPESADGADRADGAPRGESRRHRRAAYEHEAVVLDADRERARKVLFARDLSVGGARVDPHPDLQLGDRFGFALYDALFSESVVVDAEVLRDDGSRGLALRFVDTPAHTVRKIEHILKRLGEIEHPDAEGDSLHVIVAEVTGPDPE